MALVTVTVDLLHFVPTPGSVVLNALGQKAHVKLTDQHGAAPDPAVFKLSDTDPAVATASLAGDGMDVVAVANGSVQIDLVPISV